MQQHGRPELRGDEVEGEQQWKQVGCKMMSSSLVTMFFSVTDVVIISDSLCERQQCHQLVTMYVTVKTFSLVTVDLRDWARREVGVKVFHLVRSQ